jgi:MoaA/NifB/PqqE/SkfB family radical SAM enzyme
VTNSTPYPNQLFYCFSAKCNQNCIFCSAHDQPMTPVAPLAQFEALGPLLDNVNIIDIGGVGEIMMHPEFRGIVGLLTAKGRSFSFSTNGLLLSDEMLNFLAQSSLYLLNISVNSFDRDTHRMLTGAAGFDRLKDNLEILQDLPRRFQVTASMVVTGYNFRQMPSFLAWSNHYGFDKARFLPLTTNYTYSDPGLLVPHTPEVDDILARCHEISLAMGLPIQIFSYDLPARQAGIKTCRAPWMATMVNMYGSVTPCCGINEPVGNINETPWLEIWNGDKMSRLRAAISSGDTSFCSHCREFG